MTYEEQQQENIKLDKKTFAKVSGRTLVLLLAKNEDGATKAITNLLGQQGAKLFLDKYGSYIDQELSKISHKVINYAKAVYQYDYETHIEALAKSLADDIWKENSISPKTRNT